MRMGHGKSWISNIVKSRPENPGEQGQIMEKPGRLDVCTDKLKFLSRFLANGVTTCLFVRRFHNISGCPRSWIFLYGPGKDPEF